MNDALPPGLYALLDPLSGDVVDQARLLVGAGGRVAQLRCKGWAPERLLAAARAIRALPLHLVVNDDLAVATAVGAWVHLGQGDGDARGAPHGRSCHTLDEIDAAPCEGLRYVGFGPVFATGTKATGYDPRGLDLLAAAVRRSSVPVVAIGGITAENVHEVRAAGAWGWAVLGGIWAAADPAAAVRALTPG